MESFVSRVKFSRRSRVRDGYVSRTPNLGYLDFLIIPQSVCFTNSKFEYNQTTSDYPVAWQGQYGPLPWSRSRIAIYGFGTVPSGSLNDINIWERTPLLELFLYGRFTKKNLEYNIVVIYHLQEPIKTIYSEGVNPQRQLAEE